MVVSMSKMMLWLAVLQVAVALEENCVLQSHPVAGLDFYFSSLGLQKGRDGELLLEDRDLLAPKAKEAEAEPAEEWCSSRSPSAGTDKDAKGHICWTPLHFAARERHADCVELLLKTGAGFEQQLHAVGMASFCGAVERRPAVFVLRILRHPQVTGSTL
ncbi:unnamed protein product [Symbiodinium sp. KB8]|nr:unnamed protein product [Symbiodinium sp. KB8]